MAHQWRHRLDLDLCPVVVVVPSRCSVVVDVPSRCSVVVVVPSLRSVFVVVPSRCSVVVETNVGDTATTDDTTVAQFVGARRDDVVRGESIDADVGLVVASILAVLSCDPYRCWKPYVALDIGYGPVLENSIRQDRIAEVVEDVKKAAVERTRDMTVELTEDLLLVDDVVVAVEVGNAADVDVVEVGNAADVVVVEAENTAVVAVEVGNAAVEAGIEADDVVVVAVEVGNAAVVDVEAGNVADVAVEVGNAAVVVVVEAAKDATSKVVDVVEAGNAAVVDAAKDTHHRHDQTSAAVQSRNGECEL